MKKTLLLMPIVFLCLFACRKSPDTAPLSNNFVVQTSRQPDADFASYKTFYISDTVALKSTNPNDSLLTDAAAKQLVDAVKTNMASRGYTFVASSQNSPDLGLGFNRCQGSKCWCDLPRMVVGILGWLLLGLLRLSALLSMVWWWRCVYYSHRNDHVGLH